jgi:hypothetical protein
MRATCPVYLILLHCNNFWWRVQTMQILHFSSASCYFNPFGPKHPLYVRFCLRFDIGGQAWGRGVRLLMEWKQVELVTGRNMFWKIIFLWPLTQTDFWVVNIAINVAVCIAWRCGNCGALWMFCGVVRSLQQNTWDAATVAVRKGSGCLLQDVFRRWICNLIWRMRSQSVCLFLRYIKKYRSKRSGL